MRLALLLLTGCATSQLPASDAGLRLMTFNMANGAGDRFRTSEQRAAQTPIVAQAEVIALQEVDVGVERSGSVNTAVEIAGPELAGCVSGSISSDGVIVCSAAAGAVIFGVGFRGDDLFSATDGGLPLGIPDGDTSLNPAGTDRRPTAFYGNALIIRRRQVDSAVVVALPSSAAAPVSLARYEGLANGPLEELAAHNLQLRNSEGIEPRSVLVARIARPGRAPLAAMALHLEAGNEGPLRLAQLRAAIAVAKGERARGRAVAVLGDFNMTPAEAEAAFADAGFSRAAGEAIDQIWTDSTLSLSDAMELATDGGSDHPWAPSVTVR